MSKQKIAIGSDHAGYAYKEHIKTFLNNKGYELTDVGTHSEASVDYPDFAHPLSNLVENKDVTLGILICGSANGVAMSANKHSGIRAAICWTSELAKLARQHNDANVLCLPARFISLEEAENITDAFLHADFEGGRHQNRVNKMNP